MRRAVIQIVTPAPGTTQINARIPSELVDRLDALAEAMTAAVPGAKLTRSDALRAALEHGLPDLEQKYGVTKRGEAAKGGSKRPAR